MAMKHLVSCWHFDVCIFCDLPLKGNLKNQCKVVPPSLYLKGMDKTLPNELVSLLFLFLQIQGVSGYYGRYLVPTLPCQMPVLRGACITSMSVKQACAHSNQRNLHIQGIPSNCTSL